jgi:hypothetical protein
MNSFSNQNERFRVLEEFFQAILDPSVLASVDSKVGIGPGAAHC